LNLCTWLDKSNDPRYTPTTCFKTFPFPQGLSPADNAPRSDDSETDENKPTEPEDDDNRNVETDDNQKTVVMFNKATLAPVTDSAILAHAVAIAEAAFILKINCAKTG
jgi:hypothetical protein